MRARGLRGLYAFTFDTLDMDSTVHARAFVPLAGIPEDPVTGTAAGASARTSGDTTRWMGSSTRYSSSRPLPRPAGHGRVESDGDEVRVGGRAVTTFDGDLVIPDDDEDEIIGSDGRRRGDPSPQCRRTGRRSD